MTSTYLKKIFPMTWKRAKPIPPAEYTISFDTSSQYITNTITPFDIKENSTAIYQSANSNVVTFTEDLVDVPIIHNVRWGTEETWDYCFDGIPTNSIVAIGTIASGLSRIENRQLFENGFNRMIEVIKPKAVVLYGSSKNEAIAAAKIKGITIVPFESRTSLAHQKREALYE